MSEDLTDYLLESGVKARYLHSEIDTLERIQIIRELRLGEYDVLVGVNLLREGLDLPEVSLVAILDADKEGFLRGRTSLIQTIGRAARNINGRVLMYADKQTEAIKEALDETNRRRAIQIAYNEEHGIVPQTVTKGVCDIAELLPLEAPHVPSRRRRGSRRSRGCRARSSRSSSITLEEEMYVAAEELRFEYAAKLRDEIKDLRRELQLRSRRGRPSHVPQHPHALQHRAGRVGGRGARSGAAVRAQDQRLSKPSKANEEAFERAVDEIAAITWRLVNQLETRAARTRRSRARPVVAIRRRPPRDIGMARSDRNRRERPDGGRGPRTRQFRWRTIECPVCHRPPRGCTCRWLSRQ